ncbi:MAG: hypothetical protein KBD06_00705 [Candidatus Pacebacteria bacterium]|nr:hypothetical protein [Candidatus Paceibacterota bacterium]
MALINVATSTVIGLLVVFADRRSRLNQLFGAFAATIVWWSFCYFSWQVSSNAADAEFWTRMFMAGAICITPVYFHFVAQLLGVITKYKRYIIGGYVFVIVFELLNWTPAFIRGVSSRTMFDFAFWPDAGPLFAPFLIIWIFYASLPAYLLARDYFRDHTIHPLTAKLILTGTIIGYVGGCSNFFLWYEIPVLPLGNISASIYTALVAYAIMKNGLFSMKVIATELLIFALWLFLFVRMLLADEFSAQVLEASLLGASLLIGVLLIRSVDKEVKQREEIERLSQEKSEFMTFASHEIRNPITAMRGLASLIVDGTTGPVPADTRDAAQKILVAGHDVLNIIATYLSKSKMELGQISYDKAVFDLGYAASSIADGYVPHAEVKGLKLDIAIDRSQKYSILGDQGKVKEVIGNIIDNSLKYTKEGGITVSVERHGPFVRAVISDTGVGIPKGTIDQLFKKFSRADAQKVNLLGTGIGLYLAKTFIEAQGGRIWAESDGENKGSRFIVEFPAAQA